MSRKARIGLGGAVYRVISRGNRGDVFARGTTSDLFGSCVQSAKFDPFSFYGVLLGGRDYSPYGDVWFDKWYDSSAKSAFGVTGFGFSTEYKDESGLVDFGFRYYRPDLGRFISRDPAGEAGSGVNLYAFAGNDPVNNRELFGLCPVNETSGLWSVFNSIKNAIGNFFSNVFNTAFALIDGVGQSIASLGASIGSSLMSAAESISDFIVSVQNNSPNNGSWVGNVLRQIPFVGGTLGAIGDIVSGFGNVALGVATFGRSGTFARGFGQIGTGINVFSADIAAATYGFTIGKITSIVLGVGNLLTGNYFAANYLNDPKPEGRGFFAGLSNFLRSMVIPNYGLNLGVNYGGVQQRFIEPQFARSFNQLDAVSYQHDLDQDNRNWVRSSSSTQENITPTGPIGTIINIIGAPVFWLTPSR